MQNYIFLSIIPQIYRDNCGFLPLPKCKKAGYGTRKTTPSTKTRISPRRLHQRCFPLVRAPGNRAHGLEKQEGQQRAVLKDVPQLRIRKKCVNTQKIRMALLVHANKWLFIHLRISAINKTEDFERRSQEILRAIVIPSQSAKKAGNGTWRFASSTKARISPRRFHQKLFSTGLNTRKQSSRLWKSRGMQYATQAQGNIPAISVTEGLRPTTRFASSRRSTRGRWRKL